jgi:hypothetical protein
MTCHLLLASSAFLIVSAASAWAQGPQFVNGGFEVPKTAEIDIIYTGSPDLVGWRVLGGSVEAIPSSIWTPSVGNQSLDLVGVLVRGAIAQEISFSSAGRYYLSFDLSRNPGVQPPVELGVWYKPAAATDFVGLGAFQFAEAVSNSDMRWRPEGTGSFSVDPGTYTFAFASLTGGGPSTDTWGGPALDNIELRAGESGFSPALPPAFVVPPTLVPEPVHLASIVLAGVSMLSALGFRRRQ